MKLLPPLLWISMLALIGVCYGTGWGATLMPPIWSWLGIGILITGLTINIISARKFGRVKTNIKTFNDPDILVTTGFFAFSRNPMYLGFSLSLLGAALLANTITALAPVTFFFLVCQFHYIPFEERAVSRVFGDAWREYSERVRRWI